MDYYQILKNYNDVLEPADIQEILMIGRNTAYHYLSKGLIKSIKIAGKYRIPKLYLLEFIYPDMNFTTFRIDNIDEEFMLDGVNKQIKEDQENVPT